MADNEVRLVNELMDGVDQALFEVAPQYEIDTDPVRLIMNNLAHTVLTETDKAAQAGAIAAAATAAGATIGGLLGAEVGGPFGSAIGAALGTAVGSVLGVILTGIVRDFIADQLD